MKPIRVDGQHLMCDGEWHAYIEGLRFGKGGDRPLSAITQDIADAVNSRPALLKELEAVTKQRDYYESVICEIVAAIGRPKP